MNSTSTLKPQRERMPATMDTFVTSLTAVITPTALWGVVASVAPVIAITVLFSLGLYFVRRQVKAVAKGKAKL